MIIKRQNMSENKWNHFKIVPQGHNNCQLSIVNCQFGEAAKFQFIFYPFYRGARATSATASRKAAQAASQADWVPLRSPPPKFVSLGGA